MTKPSYHDILTLAHQGNAISKEGFVAFYLEDCSPYASEIHLEAALEAADKITAAAARIRAALSGSDAELTALDEPAPEDEAA